MSVKTFREYQSQLRSIAINAKLQNAHHSFNLEFDTKNRAKVETLPQHPLIFADEATFSFYEVLYLENGKIKRYSYGFSYTRKTGFWFRYDKDPIAAKYPEHNECHLHVHPNEREPRFITHETNCEEMLSFILATYYP
jgi:hypothetical protein